MNCPSRTDEPLEADGQNQNPPGLAADLTTRQDMNGMVNRRTQRQSSLRHSDEQTMEIQDGLSGPLPPGYQKEQTVDGVEGKSTSQTKEVPIATPNTNQPPHLFGSGSKSPGWSRILGYLQFGGRTLTKYSKFVGPGFMISVAYIDPGNYSTDVAAGASTKFQLLFVVLMSNVFAILLQSLAIRLGTVTGLNLAESCRAFLPRWLNLILYVMGEGAIIATDIAEVSFETG